MTKINIPTTIKEATAQLGGLDDLITAKEWTRAAIVYAFTYEGKNQYDSASRKSARHSISDFTRLGVAGLTHHASVSAYRDAWKKAIADGDADDVKPGDRVVLPEKDWPGRSDTDGKRRYIEDNPNAISRAMSKKDELFVDTFTQNLDEGIAEQIVARIAEDRPDVAAAAIASNVAATNAVSRATQEKWKEREREVERDEVQQRLTKAGKFLEGLGKLDRARHLVNEALDIFRSLTLTDRQREQVRETTGYLIPSVEWMSEFAKSRTRKTLGEEVEQFLSEQV